MSGTRCSRWCCLSINLYTSSGKFKLSVLLKFQPHCVYLGQIHPIPIPSSVSLSVCLSVGLSLCLSVSLSISVCLSLSLPLSVCLSVCLSFTLSPSVCLSVCLSLSLSLFFGEKTNTRELSPTRRYSYYGTNIITLVNKNNSHFCFKLYYCYYYCNYPHTS